MNTERDFNWIEKNIVWRTEEAAILIIPITFIINVKNVTVVCVPTKPKRWKLS